ncbi:hypothetical protein SprV_0401514900 [Sparganum proliferum]
MQGRVLVPTLFSLMFSVIPASANLDERPGIRVAYCMYSQLSSHRRIHFQSRVSTTAIHKLLFVDDCALSATTEGDKQRIMDTFAAACDNFRLTIDT